MFIPNLVSGFFSIKDPDPGSRDQKAPDPGSGSTASYYPLIIIDEFNVPVCSGEHELRPEPAEAAAESEPPAAAVPPSGGGGGDPAGTEPAAAAGGPRLTPRHTAGAELCVGLQDTPGTVPLRSNAARILFSPDFSLPGVRTSE